MTRNVSSMKKNPGKVPRQLSILLLFFVLASSRADNSVRGTRAYQFNIIQGGLTSALADLEGSNTVTQSGSNKMKIQGQTVLSRKLLATANVTEEGETSRCQGYDELKQYYNETTQIWTIKYKALKKLKNDIQAIVECAIDGDKIHLPTDKDIQPSRTILIDKNIMLGAVINTNATKQQTPASYFPEVQISCPASGELIIAKSPSFTIINVFIKNCNESSVIKVIPECEDQQSQGTAKFRYMRIENVTLSGNNSIIEAETAHCSKLVMDNVYMRDNYCSKKACITMASNTVLNKIEFVRNNGQKSSSIFKSTEKAILHATRIVGRRNRIQLFSVFNMTLKLSQAEFYGNKYHLRETIAVDESIGGGVLRAEHSDVDIWNSTFERSIAPSGGSLYIKSSVLSIKNCSFHLNIAEKGNGGAIVASGASLVILSKTLFSKNRGVNGGSFFSDDTLKLRFDRVKFFDSNSTNEGIAYLKGGNVVMRKCHFHNCLHRALVTSAVSLSIYNSTFYNNNATHGSACSFRNASDVLIKGTQFGTNNAYKRNAGAIEVIKSTIEIRNSKFYGNYANISGGAIDLLHSDLALRDTPFRENNAGKHGGAVNAFLSSLRATNASFKFNEAKGLGGAIHLLESTDLELTLSQFSANKGHTGGAIWVYNSGRSPSIIHQRSQINPHSNGTCLDGGTQHQRSSLCSGASVAGNSQGSSSDLTQANALISNCTFQYNEAEVQGGAILLFNSSAISLTNNRFEKNEGAYGGAVFAKKSTNILFSNCVFMKNNVSSQGGSIYSSSSQLQVSASSFKKCAAGKSGGAIYLISSTATLLRNDITANKATEQCGGVCVAHNSQLNADHLNLMFNSVSDVGGGILVEPNSTFLCYRCRIESNKATGGAGLYVQSGKHLLINAQLQDSSFKSNIAQKYGGGMVLASADSRHAKFLNVDNKNGYVVLLNTNFVKNRADISGAAIVSPILDKILFSCNSSRPKQDDFLSQDELQSLNRLDVERPCTSWTGNYLTNKSSEEDAISKSAKKPISPYPPSPAKAPESSIGPAQESSPASRSIEEPSPSEAPASIETPEPAEPSTVIEEPSPSKAPESSIGSAQEITPGPYESQTPTRPRVSPQRTPSPSEVPTIVPEPLVHGHLFFSVDPTYKEQIVGDIKSGFMMVNVKSGDRLPMIHFKVVDDAGSDLASSRSVESHMLLQSPDGFLQGTIVITIKDGVGNIPRIVSFVDPGNYTLLLIPQSLSNTGIIIDEAKLIISVRDCDLGEIFIEDEQICKECDAVSYSFDPQNDKTCKPCPKKASCEGQYIVPDKGKWHKTPCHNNIKDCVHQTACIYDDRDEKLRDFASDINGCHLNKSMIEKYGEALCSKAYKGQLCGSCSDSHGLSSSFRCFKCPKKALSILLIIASICYLGAIASLLIEGYMPSKGTEITGRGLESALMSPETSAGDVPPVYIEPRGTNGGGSQTNLGQSSARGDLAVPNRAANENEDTALNAQLAKMKLTENIKILISFLQTIALAALIDVRWTAGMIGMFRFSDHVNGSTLSALFWPLSCVLSSSSAGSRAVSRMILSFLALVFALLLLLLLWNYFTKGVRRALILRRFQLGIVALTYVSYVPFTKVVMGAFYCININDSLNPYLSSKNKYWALETSLQCYEGHHSAIVSLAIIVMILVSICFPILSLLAALSNVIRDYHGNGSRIYGPLSFLYAAFKKEFICWESLIMIRKVILILIVVFAYPLGGQVQGLLSIVVLMGSHYLQILYRPFRKELDSLNNYESRSLLISSLVFAFSLFFDIRRCSQPARSLATVLIILLIIAFVVYLLFMFTMNVFEAMKAILQHEGYYLTERTSVSSIIDMYLCAHIFHTY
eukprot:g438.t1